ncbi:hypothetical protein ACIQAL_25080 [Pseudomonas sp. NPDC088368]|jgi:hypothetical protein|uniref:hypothetical protein n=1 Tax=Pseudomonas sp. NPDC088368 TaxID=3364453 RepID=UPI0037F1044C
MNARYNHIFNALVADEDDILGQLAYAAYKRQKIEFIQAFKDKNGTDPEDEDLVPFHDISNGPCQLENYRTQAAKLVKAFSEASLASEVDGLRQFYSEKASNEIRSARPGFWKGVSQSVLGSGAFTLLIGCLVFFTWSLKQGPRHVIEKVFDVTIVDIVSSGPTVAVDDLQL